MKTKNLKEGFKLNGRDMPEVAELCKQIGIRNVKDLDRFMEEPENQGLDLLTALRNWRKLLGPDFQINESLKEDIEKIYSPGSDEYAVLSKVADILTKSSDSKDYIVKDVYLDFGLDWMWTTIVAQTRNNNSALGSYQVLNPRDYKLLLSADTYEQGLKNVLEQEKITLKESFDGKSFEADITTRNGDYIYVSDKEAIITYNDLVIEDVPYGSVHDTNYYEEPYYDTTSVDMSGFELTLDPSDILEFVGDRLPEEAYDTLDFDNEDEVDEYIINNLEKILTDVGQDLVEYYRDEAEEKAMDEAIDKANDDYYSGGYDEKLKESADNKANIIEFPNGNYVHTRKVGNKIIAGSATNTGIMPEYQVEIDDTEDKALQDLYDLIITTHPEYLEECSLNEELSAEMQSAKQLILDAFKENEIVSELKGDAIECSYDRSILSIISKVLTSHDYFLSDFDEEDPMELFVYSPLNGEQHQNIYVTVKFNEKITVSFSESELEGFEFDECDTVVEEVQYDDIDEVKVDDAEHKYVVTEYELYPIYEPAEGGYYYEGSSIEAQTECDSLEEARKVFEEKAEEYGYEIMGVNKDIARSEDTGYVGEGGFIQIESDTDEIFDKVGSAASGWHPYQ